MSEEKNSKDTKDATSLQESDSGTTPLVSLLGQKVVQFGQEVARVSRLAPPENVKLKKTIDTFGLNGSASSASVDLQRSLESRLLPQLPTGGLTMFIRGWKRKATPSGRWYCQLAPSVRPIDESGCGLWATPNTMDYLAERSYEAMKRMAQNGGRKGRTFPGNLREQVSLRMCEAYREAMVENGKTPALWATPNTADKRGTNGGGQGKSLRTDAAMMRGHEVFGLPAPMESRGSLNPEFPCWLMGIPEEWVSSMQQAMLSYRK